MGSDGQGTRPLVARAAQSIAESLGLADTMVDVLRERAFKPYAEGLRQYLILRLGSEEEGAQAFQELRAVVAGQGMTELLEPPGMRAHLYKFARDIVEQHWEQGDGAAVAGGGAIPWRQPGFGASEAYLHALATLRRGLPSGEAELLELRYARELETEELSFLLDIEADKLELRLEMALAQARRLLGGKWSDPETSLDTLLLEAYAIAQPSRSEATPRGIKGAALVEGDIIGERYEVQEQVGSGGMGNVYRALDTEVPGHVVALKLLHQPSHSAEARDAALRELHLIASVFHPSVVQFKDHGWYDDRLWFVMPWYEGETLQALIDRRPLRRDEARPIFEQLCHALATMHSAGIRHQDIKPDNIFLARIEGASGGEGRDLLPVLLDLGVAAKEAELVLAGTPIYFAPEVAAQYARVSDPHPVTTSADVFSLCLSLRNALEPSSKEDVAAGAVERFIENRAKKAPEPPRAEELLFLEKSFERWLSLDPDARPTASELATELKILTLPEDRRARRMRTLRVFGPLLLALIAIFASVVYGFSRQAEFQKVRAARARLEAEHARIETQRAKLEIAEVQEDLTEAAERQRQLESDVAKALTRYRSSEMTREQMTTKLAQNEGQLRMVQEMYTDEQRRSRYLRGQLDERTEERDRVKTELATTSDRLAQERSKTARLETNVGELEGQLTTAREEKARQAAELEKLRTNLEQQGGQLDELRAAKARADGRVTELEAELTKSRQELTEAQRQINLLERRLEQALRRQPSPPEPGEPSPAPGDASPAPAPPPSPPTKRAPNQPRPQLRPSNAPAASRPSN